MLKDWYEKKAEQIERSLPVDHTPKDQELLNLLKHLHNTSKTYKVNHI